MSYSKMPIRPAPAGLTLVYPFVFGISLTSDHPALSYFAPLLIYFTLLWVFGRSLLPGHQPLISKLAEMARGHLEPQVVRYTRRVTQAWTLCFALLSLESLLLVWKTPAEPGPLLINLLNIVMIIVFFLAEYGFRRYWLADLPHPSFRQYIRFLRHTDWRVFWSR